jgi:hypothetical protein
MLWPAVAPAETGSVVDGTDLAVPDSRCTFGGLADVAESRELTAALPTERCSHIAAEWDESREGEMPSRSAGAASLAFAGRSVALGGSFPFEALSIDV